MAAGELSDKKGDSERSDYAVMVFLSGCLVSKLHAQTFVSEMTREHPHQYLFSSDINMHLHPRWSRS